MVAYAEISEPVRPILPPTIQKEPSVIEPVYFILFFMVAVSLVALKGD